MSEIKQVKDEVAVCFSQDGNGKYIIPINLDFDGTCVIHKVPNVGEDNPHCVETLKKWVEKYNVGLVLHTSRSSDMVGDVLNWFNEKGIPLWGVGKNPTQNKWTDSPKSYGYYIDDMSVGIPLVMVDNERPMVDWYKLDELFTPVLEKLNKMIS